MIEPRSRLEVDLPKLDRINYLFVIKLPSKIVSNFTQPDNPVLATKLLLEQKSFSYELVEGEDKIIIAVADTEDATVGRVIDNWMDEVHSPTDNYGELIGELVHIAWEPVIVGPRLKVSLLANCYPSELSHTSLGPGIISPLVITFSGKVIRNQAVDRLGEELLSEALHSRQEGSGE